MFFNFCICVASGGLQGNFIDEQGSYFYNNWVYYKGKKELQMIKQADKKIFTIPNLLSFFRIILVFAFLHCFYSDMEYKTLWLGGILVASGISDFLDGFIARKFHMISEFGKCLDPIADKLTQLTLLICLMTKYSMAKVVLGIFLTKEILVALVGGVVIYLQGRNDGAKWYGKLSTALFFVVTIALVLFSDIITLEWANMLLLLCGVGLIGAFLGYMCQYVVFFQKYKKELK